MTTITVSDGTLDQFNDERYRLKKAKGLKMTGEEFLVYLLNLSRRVNK